MGGSVRAGVRSKYVYIIFPFTGCSFLVFLYLLYSCPLAGDIILPFVVPFYFILGSDSS